MYSKTFALEKDVKNIFTFKLLVSTLRIKGPATVVLPQSELN